MGPAPGSTVNLPRGSLSPHKTSRLPPVAHVQGPTQWQLQRPEGSLAPGPETIWKGLNKPHRADRHGTLPSRVSHQRQGPRPRRTSIQAPRNPVTLCIPRGAPFRPRFRTDEGDDARSSLPEPGGRLHRREGLPGRTQQVPEAQVGLVDCSAQRRADQCRHLGATLTCRRILHLGGGVTMTWTSRHRR